MTTGSGLTVEAAHEAVAFLRAGLQRDLQAAALALHGGAVGELGVHRFEVRVDVVHADAGLVVVSLGKLSTAPAFTSQSLVFIVSSCHRAHRVAAVGA